ncbi:Putative Holliday junction resolvase [Candidatus Protochlamydia naegleriophila]|uniref:Putative pre-16S rRNA nuclease n=1 Tax=Candidatus Protochlamydia naegleriophila TaxID=389348 RepID=A0A0U5K3B9_9BACT|nr:Holliday junction resolvase RuvX [Candidatus Protochlamydia naegleriophila]CUI16603.1 Putative Holliday junction resolvase [Candidatus Protochlamydia naegleriophila]
MQMNKPKPSRILGIDFGMSRLGLALSDERKIIAMPTATLQAEKRSEQTVLKLLETISKLCETHRCDIEEIVIGLPLMMSGRTGFLADEVKHFAQLLTQSTSVPIRLWDERLTTVQAERSLRESSLTRKKRSKVVDTVSAAIILQSYLDSRPNPELFSNAPISSV